MIEVGKTYFFQSVTHNYVGKVAKLSPAWIELAECAYIPVTGPFKDFAKGKPAEHERIADGSLIPVGGLVCVMPWEHPIPK